MLPSCCWKFDKRLSSARLAVSLAGIALFSTLAVSAEPTVDFNRDIRTLLFGKCVTCHGPDENERAAGLRLDTPSGAHEDLGGYAAVVPGDAEASELMLRITSDDEDMRMPPAGKGKPMTPAEIELLRRWINQGGQYAKHWSYQVPVRPELPTVVDQDWPRGAIDRFTLAKMESAGLQPTPAADRLTLARRVAIDLTGLPPTWEQAQTFVNDPTDNAYETYVDSLLSQPAFGERWARVWLDLARYADSAGYADDPPRTIWAYRDYVINAINQNMPFDQFTIEQIAGDLLPNPSDDQLIATAFHRNTMTNNEGGTNDEEFRNVAVVDRVNTTMAVWMGTTMACAQCHTHKYDPITHEDYFSFFAFFNSTEDADRRDESPLLKVWSESQKQLQKELPQQIAALENQIKQPSPQVDQQRKQWLAGFTTPPVWTTATSKIIAAKRDLQIDADKWITGKDSAPVDGDTYQLQIPTDSQSVTGLRLQTSADQADNFVVTQIHAHWTPTESSPTPARFVRIELPGKAKHLHLAEIQVFGNQQNLALDAVATQSSTYSDAIAARVNDGNTDGDYHHQSVQHTSQQSDPWVELDLKTTRPIDELVIWNRTDGNQSILDRLDGFKISLLDEQRNVVWSRQPEQRGQKRYSESTSGVRQIRFRSASADFQQQGFPASSVIVSPADLKTGWAVSPEQGKPHQLTLLLETPTPADPGYLTVSIEQQSVHKNHLLDHFRLQISCDDQLTRWADLPQPMQEIVARRPEQWSDQDVAAVDQYFRTIAPALEPQRIKLESLRAELQNMKPVTSVPIMRQLPDKDHRVTKIQIRGNYQSTGDTVTEGTPAVFHPIEHADDPDRLDLARWLISPDNPLTARVIANRHWEQLFGIGIVETSEEFGSQGELPSHPELLDWLAVEFRESGWDIKQLIKSIVMSATYRQSSVTTAERVDVDPANRLLARGPRFRVSAEMVRDQALFVSGLLSDKRLGPPVNPPQPELGLKAAFGSATDWKTSKGEDRFRRGLYTTWRRSSPYPSMAQFDAPNREVCTVRRIRTNTPLQALVTLNDPVYVETAQAFARNIIATGDTAEQRIRYAFHTALIRDPDDQETERLEQLVVRTREAFEQSPDQAVKLATDPIGKLPAGADPIEYAAWTVVGNVILNLDEMLMKR
ncbi:DUF1553 domain-containing protein [Stieleria tagensis]|uniref:DUF1553 domain-containing protein n=1 Tax=Stieleria tagensis TaxID=2956795 RepID=UPI00209BA77E|nr:DUF1553 domain-containing protein [Stieleria tagensis]